MAAVTTLIPYQASTLAFSPTPHPISNYQPTAPSPITIAPCRWDPEDKHFSISTQSNAITALANKALAEKLKSTMDFLESSRGEYGIGAYQLPVDDRRLLAIAESVVWSFKQPVEKQPICHKSSYSYVLITENHECRVYVDTHTDSSAGSYKQCSPALLFTIKRIHDCCVVEGKWVAKITSHGDYALPYMFWEAAVYQKLKGLENFPRLLDFFSTRGESNTLSCERNISLRSLDEAVNLKLYYEACKINQLIFYMDYHPENLHAAVVRKNSSFTLSCIPKLYHPLVSLHEAKLVHMDLKPENIVVEGEGHYAAFKLFDFNHSAPIGAVSSIKRGTISYEAPESWPTFSAPSGLCYPLEERANPATDVWSMALVLHKMKLKSYVFQPWGKLLKTLHIMQKFQQKVDKLEVSVSSASIDNEMKKKIAEDISQLVNAVEVVKSHYIDWRIDNDCYTPDMKTFFEYLEQIKEKFKAFSQLSPSHLTYFNNLKQQLLIIQHGLMSVLERYRICLEKNATAAYADPFNFIISRAMHPNPTNRPSACEILRLSSQLQPKLSAHPIT